MSPPTLLTDLNEDVLLCIIDEIKVIQEDNEKHEWHKTLVALSSVCHRLRSIVGPAAFRELPRPVRFQQVRRYYKFEGTVKSSSLMRSCVRKLTLDMPWHGRRTYEALKSLPELLQSFVQLADLAISLPRGRGRELSMIIETRTSPFILNIISLSTSFAGSMLTKYCPKLVQCRIHNTPEYEAEKDIKELNLSRWCKALSLEYPQMRTSVFDALAQRAPGIERLDLSHVRWRAFKLSSFSTSLNRFHNLQSLAFRAPFYWPKASRQDQRPWLPSIKAEIVATKLFRTCRSLNEVCYGPFNPVRLIASRNKDGMLMDVHCVPRSAKLTSHEFTAPHLMTAAQWCTTKAGTKFLAALERRRG